MWSFFTQCSFDNDRRTHGYYRDKDWMKNFCKDLRKHVMRITDFEKLKVLPLTEKENKSHYKLKLCM